MLLRKGHLNVSFFSGFFDDLPQVLEVGIVAPVTVGHRNKFTSLNVTDKAAFQHLTVYTRAKQVFFRPNKI